MKRLLLIPLYLALLPHVWAESPTFIDVHAHFQSGVNLSQGEKTALQWMDQFGISRSLLMSPPSVGDNKNRYDIEDLLFLTRDYPTRFSVLGGSSLNVMLHSISADRVDDSDRARFRARALQIADLGAVGYGEIAALHVSVPLMGQQHRYENIPADHPLLLLLADIAAERGLPIDLHCDLVPEEMPLPPVLRANKSNPDVLSENLNSLQRLLAHNPRAQIVWSHVGFEPLLTRNPQLVRTMLKQFPNLSMSFRLNRGHIKPAAALNPEREVKPVWLALLGEFPDRFMLGSDAFYDTDGTIKRGSSKEGLENFQHLLQALPEPVRTAVASGNAERIYHLTERSPQPTR
ncbi:amidohydrolase family protein [Herbaspirillum sp.]|uniref:amidohydrolase family protein n=1 Tax=Herbaspirillum sp. TaxID=1890675 RepID=UPI001B2387BF|nr:amidohydrolase family protein [Herbaspirillum sp.]MBO9537693.1 amidohydrolase family protein [Herbaspirillum sp.]